MVVVSRMPASNGRESMLDVGKSARRSTRVLLALGVMLGVSLSATAARADVAGDEQTFVDAINRTRTGVGLAPLRVDVTLVNVARGWSEKMKQASLAVTAEDCLISHNPNLRTAINLPWKKLGENVGCGDVGVDGLHAAFVNSPKHYANIVDPQFDSIGIGIVMSGDVIFVTEQFMDLNDAPPTTVAPSALALVAPKPTTKVLAATSARKTRRLVVRKGV